MSSVISGFASTPTLPTKFFDILTGSYEDDFIISGDTIAMPIPFVVNNQVLDINVNQSSDVQAFVDAGDSPGTAVLFQGKVMGGASLVKSFGPNMTTWLRNRIQVAESLGAAYSGPLTLYIRPFMTKIQLAAPRQGFGPLNDESVYGITTEAPTSTEYIGGATNDNFFTAWVFKTPMTVEYLQANGSPSYLTMTTQFSAN
jgi:hypothetical protein